MAELRPIPFADLLRRMKAEVSTSDAIFDLPTRKWFRPDPALDLSAVHFSRRAATPVGPAAGPHTQLAQNIVLAWLAGARIIELKTVQINDRLEIPRPCIHVPNVGYNVEWSQELKIEESILEYAKAAYLIEILKKTRAFGALDHDSGLETIYDISVGYDLEGIKSERVTGFLEALQDPAPYFDHLRGQIPDELREFRELELPSSISDCVTLSTFHGCPADQIEAIGKYLLGDCNLHTIIKLNPTLLGFDRVQEILIERLGYDHLELKREAFDSDLQYPDGLDILRNLKSLAESKGSAIGAKFTNTLVVANQKDYFATQRDPYMYVSGPPLHVISMTLMQQFREDLGFEFPVSFSAGVDAGNFAATVACGMVPVTTCTDLLRQGGFGRLPAYLRSLGSEMQKVGVTSREAYVLSARGHGAEAASETFASFGGAEPDLAALRRAASENPQHVVTLMREEADRLGLDPEAVVLHATRVAGRLNGRDIVKRLTGATRYWAENNEKTPRQIESELELYDCINCDLCIPACPNDAMFSYSVEPVSVDTETIFADGDGFGTEGGSGFRVEKEHQLAVLEGACNECSNCEVYCPEHGAPFQVKERVFLSKEDYQQEQELSGFCRDGDRLLARLNGLDLKLSLKEGKLADRIEGPGIDLVVDWSGLRVKSGSLAGGIRFDTALLWRVKTAWHSIFCSERPNMVNPSPGEEARYAD